MMRSFKPPKQEFLFLSNQFIWLHLLLEVIKKETGQFRSVYQREYLYELSSIRFFQHLDNVHMYALQCCQSSDESSRNETSSVCRYEQSEFWNSSICHSDKKSKLIIPNHEEIFFYKLNLLTINCKSDRVKNALDYWE